LMVGPGRH